MASDWEVLLFPEVEDWYFDLCEREPDLADRVTEAIEALVAEGPTLGRPFVDRIKGSKIYDLRNSDHREAHPIPDPLRARPETPGGPAGGR
jgi:hypothetical protein